MFAIAPDLPVVISSGYTESEVRSALEDAPLAGFIPKPYTARQFAATIRTILKQRA